jgi:hypothetical protein
VVEERLERDAHIASAGIVGRRGIQLVERARGITAPPQAQEPEARAQGHPLGDRSCLLDTPLEYDDVRR